MTKVIVIVDMQYDFIDGSLGSAEAQAIVPIMVEKLKPKHSQPFSFSITCGSSDPPCVSFH